MDSSLLKQTAASRPTPIKRDQRRAARRMPVVQHPRAVTADILSIAEERINVGEAVQHDPADRHGNALAAPPMSCAGCEAFTELQPPAGPV